MSDLPEEAVQAGAEAWRERAETAESAIAHVRHVCHQAMAEPDAPGMWLVAQRVLAALDDTKPETGDDDGHGRA
jgi:hypothetical protein